MVVLGTTIHEFASAVQISPIETRGWSTKSDHDGVGSNAGAYFFTIHSCAGSFLNTQRRFGPAITFK
jgi:hypothetical protein